MGLTSRPFSRHGSHKGEAMILIGENINVMSKIVGPALKERNPGPIQELVKAEVEAGMDYLDLNIGPARKGGG